MVQPDIKSNIGKFIEIIQGLDSALNESFNALSKAAAGGEAQLEDFIADRLELSELEGKNVYRFRQNGHADSIQSLIGSYRKFFFARKALERTKASCRNLPRTFFMMLAHAYDEYVGALCKSLFYLRPELLESSGASLTFAELSKFESLEHAREYLVEKEIDSLLRKSHVEQVIWLEEKLGIDLRTELAAPPEFIELMERRNLHIHNDGIISPRYLEICSQHKVLTEGLKAGHPLEISREYAGAAYNVIYETGVKLGDLLWLKVVPEQNAKANAYLQDLTFSLIQEQRIQLARKLLSFANETLCKYADENNRFVFLLNGALAAYLANDKEECARMLGSQDWSARADILKLAHFVLTERFAEAASLMRKLGRENRPSKAEYLRWPLFEEFRKTPEFLSAFQDVFGDVTLAEAEVRTLQKSAVG
ncbi:MAG TPA: hypothetical protein VKU42_14400 [Candidatus Angelobacter sp.]|nr:hypothetical protein [Candidatus Angelobacter sp.]